MMVRDIPAAPPGIHSYTEDHWHQPPKNLPQGWWPQAPFNGVISSPPVQGYSPQMFYNNEPSQFSHYAPNMRSNSFPMTPLSPETYGHAAGQRAQNQSHLGYFGAAAAPHHNTYMGHHPQYAHENSMMPSMHHQHMPAFQPVFNNKPAQNKTHMGGHNIAPMWTSALKQPSLLQMNLGNMPAKMMTTEHRLSNGQISPTSAGRNSMSRVDSVVEMSAPRGPPRKPRQSGFALWVGNLPFGANVVSLKEHFARGMKNEIESVCLLQQSSCAFVNYKSAEAVAAAQQRFNSSVFGNVRLICRVRNGKDQSATGRVSPPPGLQKSTGSEIADELADLALSDPAVSDTASSSVQSPTTSTKARGGDRYFIVKSLTLQDLQVSLKNGTWETQPHNRLLLDRAFDAADNVFLVFSVNKSGEYFGYARMLSRSFAPGSADAATTGAPAIEVDHDAGLQITPTPASEIAPAGRVVRDIFRNTIFWEADPEESGAEDAEKPADAAAAEPESRQFRVDWRSVQCVPFRRTKGMRNAWNENKEVKVARDGTELETEVGKQLVALFHGADSVSVRSNST